MSRTNFVLELADGSQIKVGKSPYSNNPVVMKADVPKGRLTAFTDSNPPKGGRQNRSSRLRSKQK